MNGQRRLHDARVSSFRIRLAAPSSNFPLALARMTRTTRRQPARRCLLPPGEASVRASALRARANRPKRARAAYRPNACILGKAARSNLARLAPGDCSDSSSKAKVPGSVGDSERQHIAASPRARTRPWWCDQAVALLASRSVCDESRPKGLWREVGAGSLRSELETLASGREMDGGREGQPSGCPSREVLSRRPPTAASEDMGRRLRAPTRTRSRCPRGRTPTASARFRCSSASRSP